MSAHSPKRPRSRSSACRSAARKCHNHPLEKWTQDEYWAFANLFSRVGLKNGDRPGEVLVQSRLDGDALHLRRGVPMPPMPLDAQAARARFNRSTGASTSPTGSRRADNPYFAKALVNRVWRNYMGRGLVEAEDDLRVSNPAEQRGTARRARRGLRQEQVRREAPDADRSSTPPRISARRNRCRRTRPTIASIRAISSAGFRPR